MNHYFVLTLLLSCSTVLTAQKSNFSHMSGEFNLGLTNPIQPLAPGYDAKTLSPFTVGLGSRYMFNQFIGLRVNAYVHQFNNAKGYNTFKTNYFRTDLEGVINAGNVLRFYEWTDNFTFLIHTGVGYSIMKEKSWTYNPDQMMNFNVGVTPMVKLNKNLSLLLDFVTVSHVYQSRTFDFSQSNVKRGADGYLFNVTAGITYSFGNKPAIDWQPPVDLTKELDDLNAKMDSLKQQQLDDDNDGVPNYLDQEPSTAANAMVNTKGVTIDKTQLDSDSDGTNDAQDNCPFEKGPESTKGCPDQDNDGVEDKLDKCPYLAGAVAEMGCPEISETFKANLTAAQNSLKFAAKKYDLNAEGKAALGKIAEELKQHPEMNLVIGAHVNAGASSVSDIKLSQDRANAIRFYLIGLGINKDRLIALGMGTTQPLYEQGNAKNERIELKVKF